MATKSGIICRKDEIRIKALTKHCIRFTFALEWHLWTRRETSLNSNDINQYNHMATHISRGSSVVPLFDNVIDSLRNYMKEFGTRGLHKSANSLFGGAIPLVVGLAAETRKHCFVTLCEKTTVLTF